MDDDGLGTGDLAGPVRQAPITLQKVYAHRAVFDPATSQRTLWISMTDISQLVLLPRLGERLRRAPPGVRIDIVPLSNDAARMLEAGEADLALGFMPQLEAGLFQLWSGCF